jgi:hypothetical protein
MPPAGPPISRTTPSLAESNELALVSNGPVPTTAGIRACMAGANSTLPALSAASEA